MRTASASATPGTEDLHDSHPCVRVLTVHDDDLLVGLQFMCTVHESFRAVKDCCHELGLHDTALLRSMNALRTTFSCRSAIAITTMDFVNVAVTRHIRVVAEHSTEFANTRRCVWNVQPN